MDAAEQWEPDDARVSLPVLRERGAAIAPRHSPGVQIAGARMYCGVPSTTKARFSTCWFRGGAILRARPQIIESTFDRVRYWVYNQVEYRML
jgi:hypothetical protein